MAEPRTWREIAAAHVEDPRTGVHRTEGAPDLLTYECAECCMDWPCDTVLIAQQAVTLVTPQDYNAVCEDREVWRRLTGEAQAEAADLLTTLEAEVAAVEQEWLWKVAVLALLAKHREEARDA